ncbi:MAG: MvdD family ATP-grasp ribosomal peptide maturase [Planctomycetes bacterium]|nr:MvdD family ATP-grasp ribosomal peptide maturase [Planctomycetota bacterium]
MTSRPSVLIVTHSGDAEVPDLVARAVEKRGATPCRLDTDRFPMETRIAVRQDSTAPPRWILRQETDEIDLDGIQGVWYRRVAAPRLDEVDEKYRAACRDESRALLLGLFSSLDHARWVDPIARVRQAEHKILQLEVARRVGLAVPDTLTTNDPDDVRRFHEAHGGRIVSKMQHAFAVKDGGAELAYFTRPVPPEDLEKLAGLRYAPMVFQEYVEKDVELRVTVVGERVFAASIESQKSDLARHDWRRDGYGLAGQFRSDRLPPDIESRVLALQRELGLLYGALDFIRTPDGRHVFLEVNPAGEWGWLELQVGLPISGALADLLTGAVRVDRPPPRFGRV